MKNLEVKFAEVEKRVKALVTDNLSLRKQVAALEQELARARQEGEQLQAFHGNRLRLREKVERILRSLEAIGEKGT